MHRSAALYRTLRLKKNGTPGLGVSQGLDRASDPNPQLGGPEGPRGYPRSTPLAHSPALVSTTYESCPSHSFLLHRTFLFLH